MFAKSGDTGHGLQLVHLRRLHDPSRRDRQDATPQDARHAQHVHVRQLSENSGQAERAAELCRLASQLLHRLLPAVG